MDIIMTTLFVLFIVYLVVGMNKQVLEKNKKDRKKDEIVD